MKKVEVDEAKIFELFNLSLKKKMRVGIYNRELLISFNVIEVQMKEKRVILEKNITLDLVKMRIKKAYIDDTLTYHITTTCNTYIMRTVPFID